MNISRFFASKYANRGFTMIELLVVIAIIGILAAAVLSAINPVEQINKGRDTGRRSDASELVNAIERYYAVQEMYPWNDDPSEAESAYTSTNWNWIQKMEAVGEVKSGLRARIAKHAQTPANMRLYKTLNSDYVAVCFEPRSKQFEDEATDRCANENGTLPTAVQSSCASTPVICMP